MNADGWIIEWIIEKGVECVSCPDCAFTFDAGHTDKDGGYSCPACAETAWGERASQLADALTAIEKKDTKLRKTKRCSDPQCGDSTWDHDCDEEWDTAPGPFAEIARAALAVSSRAAKETP